MSASSLPLPELLQRASAGDEAAAAELVAAYEPEIRRFVRFRLTSPSVRRFIDSVDVSQSVLARFFVVVQSGDVEITSHSQLRGLLLTMANHRLLDHVRRQHAARRDGRRLAGNEALEWSPAAGKTPSEFVSEKELFEMLLDRLSEQDRRLVEARLEGHSWGELAKRFGLSAEAARKRVTRALDKAAAGTKLVK